MNVTDTENSCFGALKYLEQVMNPYILNVSTASCLCSEPLYQSQGCCVQKNWNDDVYLHLNSRYYTIEQCFQGGPLTVSSSLSQEDIDYFNLNFNCMCYSKALCHSVLTLNVISGAVVNPSSGSTGRMCSLLLLFILICLKIFIM
ncbi:hypothetical protein ILYODFUR_028490 [Ilyodon furcidens]|uniref:hyaluronoglucosaminidase n=1 Tax=Ilyodon furcidens TaxID=33524 RepID=A0ABV0TR67_9TELE